MHQGELRRLKKAFKLACEQIADCASNTGRCTTDLDCADCWQKYFLDKAEGSEKV